MPRLYLNIFKTEKILQLWDKKFSTCVARHGPSERGQNTNFQETELERVIFVINIHLLLLIKEERTNQNFASSNTE